jgi:hypothetical protein
MCDCRFWQMCAIVSCFLSRSSSRRRGRGRVVLPTDVPTQGRARRNNGSDLHRPVATAGGVAGAR